MDIYSKVAQFYQSPQELQHLSNLVHNVGGVLVILLALFMIGYLFWKSAWLKIYPLFIISISLLIIGITLFNKGLTHIFSLASLAWYFPHLRIHYFMSTVIFVAGLFELWFVLKKDKRFALCFPLLLMVYGALNIVHPSGSHHLSMQFHAYFGTVMIFSGALLAMSRLSKNKLFFFSSMAFLVLGGIMMIGFSEPATEYSYAFANMYPNYVTMNEQAVLYITSEQVIPRSISLSAGGKVLFVQVDESIHEISSGPHPTHQDYLPLNIGMLRQGERKEVIFDIPGTYGFHDHLNENSLQFVGEIIVK